MGKVERGVVKPPNEETPHGNRVMGSNPLTHGAAFGDVPNNKNRSARENSSSSLGRSQGVVKDPNHDLKFKVEDAHDGYTGDGVVSPGKGAIPVEPSNPFGGNFVPAHMLGDRAKA